MFCFARQFVSFSTGFDISTGAWALSVCQYCCIFFLFSFLGVVHLSRYFLLYVFVWFQAQVVRFCPFWYIAFDVSYLFQQQCGYFSDVDGVD